MSRCCRGHQFSACVKAVFPLLQAGALPTDPETSHCLPSMMSADFLCKILTADLEYSRERMGGCRMRLCYVCKRSRWQGHPWAVSLQKVSVHMMRKGLSFQTGFPWEDNSLAEAADRPKALYRLKLQYRLLHSSGALVFSWSVYMCLLACVLHAWLLYVYRGDVCTASIMSIIMEVFHIAYFAMSQNGVLHRITIKKIAYISNPGGTGCGNMFKTCTKAEGENSGGINKRGGEYIWMQAHFPHWGPGALDKTMMETQATSSWFAFTNWCFPACHVIFMAVRTALFALLLKL